ncbi:unnamed protein product [Gongylonema pulchrum]|uniref:Glucuronosyltransferase n=1 Tax=Gongylonema pulchrum TaxID=637853 RepID=A0A183D590_9BILA|nr:unnamed protein product [Gongylonema pulchrum]
MTRCYWHFNCFFVICFTSLNAYKILIFNPRFGKSLVRFIGSIADTLVEAGHDVTQFSPTLTSLADTNGSRLAKTINVDCEKQLKELFDVDAFVQYSWKQKYQSVSGVFSVGLYESLHKTVISYRSLQYSYE